MSSRLTLSPDQLDRLEDALEDLELGPEPDFDLDDPVDQQLSEFRDLLVLSREAMPLEDVPAGLLDGVLAEARQAAAAPAATEGESFWSRFRLGTWLPTLAFAGSAAALLVVLLPQTGSEPPAADSSAVARADANEKNQPVTLSLQGDELARAVEQAQAGKDEFTGDATARGQGVVIGERAPGASTPAQAPAAEPEPVADEERDEEAIVDDEVYSKRRTSGKKADAKPMPTKPAPKPKGKKPSPGLGGGSSSGMGKGGGGAFPQSPTPSPSNKSEEAPADLFSEVLEGDKLRNRGNCGLARMRYDKARKLSDVARVRGRSLAGLGLCEYAAGNEGKAKKLFAQARAAYPQVAGFIDQELARLDLGGEPDAAVEADQTKD